MGEIEAVTRASAAQIILAKLILAGAAQIVCLTVICWFAIVVAEYPVTLIQLIMYVIVPIFRMFNIDTLEYEKKRTVRNTMQCCIMLGSKCFCRYACTLVPCNLRYFCNRSLVYNICIIYGTFLQKKYRC
mgnify:CR=1 FL=1